MMDFVERKINLGYAEINLCEFGQGKELFLIPGFPFSAKSYFFFKPYLEKDYHVIALDLPGLMGNSRILDTSPFSIDTYTKIILDTLENIYPKDQKIMIGGASIGGILSLLVASEWPEKFTQIISFAAPIKGSVFGDDNPRLMKAIRYAGKTPLIGRLLKRWMYHFKIIKLNSIVSTSDTISSIKRHLINEYWSIKPNEAIAFLCDLFNQDFTEKYKRVSVPVILIAGDEDRTFPIESIRETAQLIPNCKYTEIKGADHLFVVRDPARFTQIIRENQIL